MPPDDTPLPPPDPYAPIVPPTPFDGLKFEADYIKHLTSLSLGTVAFVIAFVKDRPGEERSPLLPLALTAFVLAATLASAGYAIKNYWVAMGRRKRPWVVAFDRYVLGGLTVVAFAVGLVALLGFYLRNWDK